VLVSKPARMARNPVYGSGRNTPVKITSSPALTERQMGPRRWMRMVRGVEPSGTYRCVYVFVCACVREIVH